MQTLNYAQSLLFGTVSRVNQKTSSKKKIDVSAERRPQGAGCTKFYASRSRLQRFFNSREGLCWKGRTCMKDENLLLCWYTHCWAIFSMRRQSTVTIFRLSFKPVVNCYLILGWSQLRTFKWMWICVMGNFMEECMSQKFGMRLYR